MNMKGWMVSETSATPTKITALFSRREYFLRKERGWRWIM